MYDIIYAVQIAAKHREETTMKLVRERKYIDSKDIDSPVAVCPYCGRQHLQVADDCAEWVRRYVQEVYTPEKYVEVYTTEKEKGDKTCNGA